LINRIAWFVTVCAFLFILYSPSDSQTHEYDWASIDEESFESFQPTDKIMAAIGITEGMRVGEVGS